MQDLVALIAGQAEPLRRLPDLGRIVVPELVGDELVNGEVESHVDPLAAVDDFLPVMVDGACELRVLGQDQQPAVVGVGGIEEREVEMAERAVPAWARELAPVDLHSKTILGLSFRHAPSYAVSMRVLLGLVVAGVLAGTAAGARAPDGHDRALMGQLEAKVQLYEGLGSSSNADARVKQCAFVKQDPSKELAASFAVVPVYVIEAVTKFKGPFRDIERTLAATHPHDDLFRRWVAAERAEVAFLLRFDNGGKAIDICSAAQLLMQKQPPPAKVRAALGIDPALVPLALLRALKTNTPLSKLNPPMRTFFIAGGVSRKHAEQLTS